MNPKILLRKLNSYRPKRIESFVRESVTLFSNQGQLFSAENRVLLKPNLLRGFSPERCVTTHPAVIDAVCRVLKDLGVKRIDLSDSPAIGSLLVVARKAGYGEATNHSQKPISFRSAAYTWSIINESNRF